MVLLGAIALSILLVEVAARAFAKLTGQERAVIFDPELGWHMLPHVRKKSPPFWGMRRPAVTNSHGWRDRERSYDGTGGARRVVIIGDSMVFGHGVDDGERFADLLEQRCDHVEFINLGCCGFSADQYVRVLELEGFRYRPDVVILVLCMANDVTCLVHEQQEFWPKPYYRLEHGEPTLVKPRYNFAVFLRNNSYLAEFVCQEYPGLVDRYRRAPEWRGGDPLPLFAALMRRMAKECAERNVHFLVVPVYWLEAERTEPTNELRRQRAAIEEAGVVTLDTHTLFAEPVRRGQSVFMEDGLHWNPRGNGIMADFLDTHLRELGWRERSGQ
jgi:hypothetical protein